MTTLVQLPVGEFPVDAHTYFHIGWNEGGATLSLCQRKRRRRYRVIVDGSAIVHAAVEAVTYKAPPFPEPTSSEDDAESSRAPDNGLRTVRIVQLLDCNPGNRDHPEGEPVAVVDLGHLGEAEEPIMLDLTDTKRLAIKLLVVLATHGDDTADAAIRSYFLDDVIKDQNG